MRVYDWSLEDVLKDLIRARGEDPARYLKAELNSAIDVIAPDGGSEVYARAVWGSPEGPVKGALLGVWRTR